MATYTCPQCGGGRMVRKGKITVLCPRCGGKGMVSFPASGKR